jgi:hypothetical protein
VKVIIFKSFVYDPEGWQETVGMTQGLTQGLSEMQLALYTDEYYERSDLIFRFGALLSLSREGGERLTEETFHALIDDFSQVKSGTSPVVLLMALAWKAWNKIKGQKFHEWNLPILQSLKTLGVEQRAALFAVEVAGLEIDEAAKIFGTSDTLLRQMLAQANRHLAVNTVRV